MLIDVVKKKIEQTLLGSEVQVENQSGDHAGHNPSGAHIGVLVKYAGFEGKTMLEQHQMIYDILKEEMKEQIHALVIKTST